MIKIVKQIFNTPQEEDLDQKPADKQKKEKEAPKKDSLATALNSAEYKVIFDFFVIDIPDLVL